MANGSGVAVAGLIVGMIVVSQAGGPEGDTGDDGEPEVPRAVAGGLATSHADDLWARIGNGVSIPVNPRIDDQVCSSVLGAAPVTAGARFGNGLPLWCGR